MGTVPNWTVKMSDLHDLRMHMCVQHSRTDLCSPVASCCVIGCLQSLRGALCSSFLEFFHPIVDVREDVFFQMEPAVCVVLWRPCPFLCSVVPVERVSF